MTKAIFVNSERWLSLENLESEVWKDVVGYEGIYKVSNYGRVKSFWHGKMYIHRAHNNGQNYLGVMLRKNGISKYNKIHRLVAMAFIPNPNNYPQVNHKDENPQNNLLDNLEWCTASYNHDYGTRLKRFASTVKRNGKRCVPIIQLSMNGEFIKEWKSATEINEKLGYSRGNIAMCCRGKRSYHKGYRWMYKNNH